jgi:hypothetical protein
MQRENGCQTFHIEAPVRSRDALIRLVHAGTADFVEQTMIDDLPVIQ